MPFSSLSPSADRRLRRRQQAFRRTDAHAGMAPTGAPWQRTESARRARLRPAAPAVLRRPARPHPLLGRRVHLRHQRRATRTISRAAARSALRRRRARRARRTRSSARLHGRHRPRGVLRRGRSVLDAGLAGVRHPLCQILRQPETRATASTPPCPGCSRPASRIRRRPGSFSLPGVDCDAAAVSVWQDIAGRGRGGLRPHRRVPLHHLRRLRVHREPARPPPAPQRHLPQRPRAAHSRRAISTPSHGGLPQGLWSARRDPVPQRRHRLRRADHPAQPEPERRAQFERPGRRRRRAHAAPDARAAGRDPPAQGRLRVPLRPAGGLGAGTADELCGFEQHPRAHEVPDHAAAADRASTRCATWCATR